MKQLMTEKDFNVLNGMKSTKCKTLNTPIIHMRQYWLHLDRGVGCMVVKTYQKLLSSRYPDIHVPKSILRAASTPLDTLTCEFT